LDDGPEMLAQSGPEENVTFGEILIDPPPRPQIKPVSAASGPNKSAPVVRIAISAPRLTTWIAVM